MAYQQPQQPYQQPYQQPQMQIVIEDPEIKQGEPLGDARPPSPRMGEAAERRVTYAPYNLRHNPRYNPEVPFSAERRLDFGAESGGSGSEIGTDHEPRIIQQTTVMGDLEVGLANMDLETGIEDELHNPEDYSEPEFDDGFNDLEMGA